MKILRMLIFLPHPLHLQLQFHLPNGRRKKNKEKITESAHHYFTLEDSKLKSGNKENNYKQNSEEPRKLSARKYLIVIFSDETIMMNSLFERLFSETDLRNMVACRVIGHLKLLFTN